jgi:hypothetical protein
MYAWLYAFPLLGMSLIHLICIQVLNNNAAAPVSAQLNGTAEGYEAQFGIGNLGHFLFTSLIILRASDEGSTSPAWVALPTLYAISATRIQPSSYSRTNIPNG